MQSARSWSIRLTIGVPYPLSGKIARDGGGDERKRSGSLRRIFWSGEMRAIVRSDDLRGRETLDPIDHERSASLAFFVTMKVTRNRVDEFASWRQCNELGSYREGDAGRFRSDIITQLPHTAENTQDVLEVVACPEVAATTTTKRLEFGREKVDGRNGEDAKVVRNLVAHSLAHRLGIPTVRRSDCGFGYRNDVDTNAGVDQSTQGRAFVRTVLEAEPAEPRDDGVVVACRGHIDNAVHIKCRTHTAVIERKARSRLRLRR